MDQHSQAHRKAPLLVIDKHITSYSILPAYASLLGVWKRSLETLNLLGVHESTVLDGFCHSWARESIAHPIPSQNQPSCPNFCHDAQQGLEN